VHSSALGPSRRMLGTTTMSAIRSRSAGKRTLYAHCDFFAGGYLIRDSLPRRLRWTPRHPHQESEPRPQTSAASKQYQSRENYATVAGTENCFNRPNKDWIDPRIQRVTANREDTMNRRIILSFSAITALGLALYSSSAVSQSAKDIVGTWTIGVWSHSKRPSDV